ncbi:addiction module toxin [Candidatus Regiella insecticola LSR1]|uniref:Addiction module toxin n=1 Tax=Candidatus Regiella insecticola LSR1 TaxID=663321 RepID=E0WU93_9ENTR|nr:type II toxin-antitoxin system RelE/ParE family toxin [Candidatus Regiella insecticola]EFL91422.1 addiction module toxin [Candidatus Regiella insecticola LSR1]
MIYKIKFDKKAFKEWEALTDPLRKQFAKALKKRQEQPRVPQAKLSGLADCYKIKLRASGFRLVYKVVDNTLIITVIAVGKRERNQVYVAAKKRLT